MLIFISYRHLDYDDIVVKLVRDLKAAGYEVWFDKDEMKASNDWNKRLQKAIQDSEYIFGIISKRSLVESSFCLDELLFARQNNKKIIPLKFEKVSLPLFLLRIHYVDMVETVKKIRNCTDSSIYNTMLTQIINELKGLNALEYKSDLTGIDSLLNPVNNESLLNFYKTNFVGREWVFKEYDLFLTDTSRKFFVILGMPGTGKSALVTRLTEVRDSISAVHFCVFGNEERTSPNRVIESIAFHLASQIETYKDRLMFHINSTNIKELNNKALFEKLIITPLSEIAKPENDVVIVIDALDEAKSKGGNELFDLVVSEMEKTPTWFRCVVTSRPESDIAYKLEEYDPILLHANDQSKGDYLKYIDVVKNELNIRNEFTDEEKKLMLSASNDSFIYIRELLKMSKDGIINFSKLPSKLSHLYNINFTRIISNSSINYDEYFRPVLEVVLAALADLKLSTIKSALEIDEYDFNKIVNALEMYFEKIDDCLRPRHKTVREWLLDSRNNDTYYIDIKKGHKRIFDQLLKSYRMMFIDEYTTKYICKHAILCDEYITAIELLNDYNLYTLREEVMGQVIALESYLTDVIMLKEKNKYIAEKVILGDVFKSIFNNNREIFLDTQLITLLPKIGFHRFVEKNMYSKDIFTRITILRYLRFNGDYDKQYKYTLETVESFKDSKNDFYLAKLYQFAALNCVFYGDYSKTDIFLKQALKLIDGKSEWNLEYLTLYSFYSDNLTNLMKINQSIKQLEKNVKLLNEVLGEEGLSSYFKKNVSIQLLDAQRCLIKTHTLTGEIDKAEYYLRNTDNLNIDYIQYYEDYNKFKIVEMFYYVASKQHTKVNALYDYLISNLTTDYHYAMLHYYYSIYLLMIGEKKDDILDEIEKGIKYGLKRNNRSIVEHLYVVESIAKRFNCVEEANIDYLNQNRKYFEYFEWLFTMIKNNILD